VGWTVASYLQARERPKSIFWLEALKLVLLVGGIVTFGRISPLWTCVAVGVSFGAHALASLWVVHRLEGISVRPLLGSLIPALGACLVMVGAVLLVRSAVGGVGAIAPALELSLEVLAGALAYSLAALGLARETSRDLWLKLRDAIRPRALPS
jgi:PST family polysaccharide transporter